VAVAAELLVLLVKTKFSKVGTIRLAEMKNAERLDLSIRADLAVMSFKLAETHDSSEKGVRVCSHAKCR
jgi:hypothetical protein